MPDALFEAEKRRATLILRRALLKSGGVPDEAKISVSARRMASYAAAVIAERRRFERRKADEEAKKAISAST